MDRSELIAQIPGLRRYARALTRSVWEADDLVQDTLERACSRWRLWTVGSNLRAWLFSIMHNLYTDQSRRTLRMCEAGLPLDIDELASELAAPAVPTDDNIDLKRCLLLLPEAQREVLLLVCLEGMDYAQVAQVTGTPIGTVMSRLSRARLRLQELLDAPASPYQRASVDPAPAPVLRRLK